MNRVTCSVCSETALESPLTAEALEGTAHGCPHCSAFGRITLREDDEGWAVMLVLTVDPCTRCKGGPLGACDCEDPAVVGYQE